MLAKSKDFEIRMSYTYLRVQGAAVDSINLKMFSLMGIVLISYHLLCRQRP